MATIKTVFGDDIRRFHLPNDVKKRGEAFGWLQGHLQKAYGLQSLRIRYTDDEGDLCLVSSEEELLEALRLVSKGKVLKMLIEVDEEKSQGLGKSQILEKPQSVEPPQTVEKFQVIEKQPQAAVEKVQTVEKPQGEKPQIEMKPQTPSTPEVINPKHILERLDQPQFIKPSSPPPTTPATPEVINSKHKEEKLDQPPFKQPSEQQVVEEVKEDKKVDKEISKEMIHPNIICDGCGMEPLRGIRYKCTVCSDFDLCGDCESTGQHPMDHILLKAKEPLPDGFRFIPPAGLPPPSRRPESNKRNEPKPKAAFVRENNS
jgi:hypothetical protein